MNYTEITEDQIPSGVRFDLVPKTQGKLIEISWGGFSKRPHSAGSAFKKVYDRSSGDIRRETTKYFRADTWKEIREHELASNAH